MEKFRKWLRAASVVLVFLLAWFLWPRELDSVHDIAQGIVTVPDYRMQNLRYVSVKSGDREVELRAKTGDFFIEKYELGLKDMSGTVFNEKGEATAFIAQRGVYHMQTRKLSLYDQITATAPDGFQLYTDDLQYALTTRMLRAPHSLRGQSADGNVKIAAEKGESNVSLQQIRLTGNATGQYIEPKHGLTTIRGDAAEMQRGDDSLTFESNVKVTQGKVAMESRTATLHYAKAPPGKLRAKEGSVRYLVARDDVVIREQAGRYTRSQVAEFYGVTDTIVLTGYPSVYDGDDAVSGDRITLYRSTGVVEATGANAAVGERLPKRKSGETSPPDEDDAELVP